MEFRIRGTRRNEFAKHNIERNLSYDYEKEGLINKLLPKVIWQTKNTTTQAMLKYIEATMVWLMKYVDRLKNFKNWNYNL